MSIFGSREDDPLLQDDPFAPSSGDEASEGNDPAANADRADDRAAGNGRSEATDRANRSEPSHSTPGDTLAGSVFEPETEPHTPSRQQPSPGEADETPRVIVRSTEQAANGQLDPLNAALGKGWRLQRVELRAASAADPEGASDTTPRSLAFVLHRPHS